MLHCSSAACELLDHRRSQLVMGSLAVVVAVVAAAAAAAAAAGVGGGGGGVGLLAFRPSCDKPAYTLLASMHERMLQLASTCVC